MNKKSILAGTTLITALTLGITPSFANIGNGNDMRNQLSTDASVLLTKSTSDLSCGQGKCGSGKKEDTTKKADSTASKTTEMKCGEGKCGNSKKDDNKSTKKSSTKTTKK